MKWSQLTFKTSDDGGNLTNVQCKPIQNSHNECPTQYIHTNKNEKT
jgi:hypothetical protein